MKKKHKLIWLIIVGIILLSLFFLFLFFRSKKDKLTLQQKQWIENNKSYVVDVALLNGVPALTLDGKGLVFDFFEYVSNETGLSFSPVALSSNSNYKVSFSITDKISKNDILVDSDNYVLIDKNNKKFNNLSDISNKNIGVLNNDIKIINKAIYQNNKITPFSNLNEMIASQDIDSYIILKNDAFKLLCQNKVDISYQFDEKKYYVLKLKGPNELNEIIRKLYNSWEKDYYFHYNQELLRNYYSIAQIDNKDQIELKNKQYTYGFIDNGIYDSIDKKNLKGINKIILKSFSEFASISVKYKKYDRILYIENDFNNKNIQIMIDNAIDKTNNQYPSMRLFDEDYMVISNNRSNYHIKDIYDLRNYKVSVIKDSKIANYLTSNKIKVKEYNNLNELLKGNNKKTILVLEKDNYDYYKTRNLKNYKIDCVINPLDYSFKLSVNKDELFNKLFNFYINYVDIEKIIDDNYSLVAYKSVDYTIILIILSCIIGLMILLKIINNVIKIVKRIIKKHHSTLTKEEKIKYIDQLTSLKNRAYLNTKVEMWDESETYPQAIIIVDLNNIAFINDNYGREEGDKTIRDAANILIQSQLPNTEIIRTDGNEFLIYAVGYNEKEIISYLRKLSKALKTLKHGFGAATGYSMILDQIKTFDDAVNEATLEMKHSKEDSLRK